MARSPWASAGSRGSSRRARPVTAAAARKAAAPLQSPGRSRSRGPRAPPGMGHRPGSRRASQPKRWSHWVVRVQVAGAGDRGPAQGAAAGQGRRGQGQAREELAAEAGVHRQVQGRGRRGGGAQPGTLGIGLPGRPQGLQGRQQGAQGRSKSRGSPSSRTGPSAFSASQGRRKRRVVPEAPSQRGPLAAGAPASVDDPGSSASLKPSPRSARARRIQRVSSASSPPRNRLVPGARAASSRARLVTDFEPGTRTGCSAAPGGGNCLQEVTGA